MNNQDQIAAIWKKTKRDGSPFYSGSVTLTPELLTGSEVEINIWVDQEALAGMNNRPAFKVVMRPKRAPGETRQASEHEEVINTDDIPF